MTTKLVSRFIRNIRDKNLKEFLLDFVTTFYRNKRVIWNEKPFRIGNERILMRLTRCEKILTGGRDESDMY